MVKGQIEVSMRGYSKPSILIMSHILIWRRWSDMSTVIDEFGQNAGKVWEMLNEKGPLSEKKLINSTFLKEHQLCAAVGWLAREN